MDDTFTKNIEAGTGLGLEIINATYPGQWQVKDGKLYKRENYSGHVLVNGRIGFRCGAV